ncbi:tetratricopeptide repeat protein [Noviherbaspirillum sp.]|uniref:tetratricopeptide repeat protein n=1 Tax=Noviherbaspirillum sp. TaxID=1926288 RepID=UPI002FE18299
MRAELQRNPKNLTAAVRLARRYYSLVGEEGDPRYLGYAQAALAPWWTAPDPPTDVLILRASLGQFRHDFAGALADLGQVIEREPGNTEARTLRAIIHIVQARYDQAKTDCRAMRQDAELIATGCEAMVDGLTGNADAAYRTLGDTLKRHPKASAPEKLWVHIRLAELAERLQRFDVAELHYRQALEFDITDGFLLAAYADLLLDLKRPADVVNLLKDKVRSDVLLLRLAFAERALNMPVAKEHEAALAARFEAAQRRGEAVHQQEEARFALYTEKDAKKALALAQDNWKVQREPRDARIFLEAGIAAKDAKAAQPVLQWLSESKIEDRYLNGLGRQLQGGGK